MSAAKHRDVRRIWADKPNYGDLRVARTRAKLGRTLWDPYPAAVVDMRPKAFERLVEKAAWAIAEETNQPWENDVVCARAVLATVLGRLPKKP